MWRYTGVGFLVLFCFADQAKICLLFLSSEDGYWRGEASKEKKKIVTLLSEDLMVFISRVTTYFF